MSSLFEDHLNRKRFIQNFSHILSGVSFNLASFRGSKIRQLLQRLFVSPVKRPFKNPQIATQKREKILSFLNILLNPAFSLGKLPKSIKGAGVGDFVLSLNDKSKILSFLVDNISSKVLYPSISAQVLAGYIRKQMSLSQKLKDLDFRVSLKAGISMLALFLFKRSPLGSSIKGMRIVCSGK